MCFRCRNHGRRTNFHSISPRHVHECRLSKKDGRTEDHAINRKAKLAASSLMKGHQGINRKAMLAASYLVKGKFSPKCVDQCMADLEGSESSVYENLASWLLLIRDSPFSDTPRLVVSSLCLTGISEDNSTFDLHEFRLPLTRAFLMCALVLLCGAPDARKNVELITGLGKHSNPVTGPVLYPLIEKTLKGLGHFEYELLEAKIRIWSPSSSRCNKIRLQAMRTLMSLPMARAHKKNDDVMRERARRIKLFRGTSWEEARKRRHRRGRIRLEAKKCRGIAGIRNHYEQGSFLRSHDESLRDEQALIESRHAIFLHSSPYLSSHVHVVPCMSFVMNRSSTWQPLSSKMLGGGPVPKPGKARNLYEAGEYRRRLEAPARDPSSILYLHGVPFLPSRPGPQKSLYHFYIKKKKTGHPKATSPNEGKGKKKGGKVPEEGGKKKKDKNEGKGKMKKGGKVPEEGGKKKKDKKNEGADTQKKGKDKGKGKKNKMNEGTGKQKNGTVPEDGGKKKKDKKK
jgi:hypothetical protein